MWLARDLKLYLGWVWIPSKDLWIALTPSFLYTFSKMYLLHIAMKVGSLYRRLFFWRHTPLVGFFPEVPKTWHQIWNVSHWSGVRFHKDISKCDALFYFEDETFPTVDPRDYAARGLTVINERCTDISKERVMAAFRQVFGYDLEIDPLTYQGKAVSKSNINAAHDGKVIDCPIAEREEGRVYQRLVDNTEDGIENGDIVFDLRTVVMGDQLPLIYLKERDISKRFENYNVTVSLAETSDHLSPEEVTQLLRFCDVMGLDVGGMDVLRDRGTGRIYVVDVNKTCMGPPVMLPFFQKMKAMSRLGRVWYRMVMDLRLKEQRR